MAAEPPSWILTAGIIVAQALVTVTAFVATARGKFSRHDERLDILEASINAHTERIGASAEQQKAVDVHLEYIREGIDEIKDTLSKARVRCAVRHPEAESGD